MQYIMGIDIGSTSLKAAIYDSEGNLFSLGTCLNEVVYLDRDHPHWAFWDPERISAGLAIVIRKALAGIAGSQSISGIAVTGMGMDGLPADEAGSWLYPFISWQCRRTQPQYRQWKDEVGSEKIFYKSGKQMLPFDTIYRLMWMKDNHPDILAKADKWVLIESYVNFLLCGCNATDFSMASSTSLLEQENRKWSKELLDIAGIDINLMPEIIPSGTIIGSITKSAATMTGLAEGTPVVMGGHDYHCAALAAGAFVPGTVMDITGTWEMVLAASNRICITDEVFKSGFAVESHVARDTYGIMGSNVSGDMLEWFRACYGYEEKLASEQEGSNEWELLMKKAETAPCGSEGVCFLPHFCGSSCPQIDPDSLGAFIGLHKAAGKGHMLRAVIEGLDYQLRDMIEAMENALQLKVQRITAVGGATRNSFWMQNKADVTGITVEVPQIEEATCLGAAMLAGIGTGVYRDEKDAFGHVFKSGCSYRPDIDSNNKYNDFYSIYKCLYPSLKQINSMISHKFKI